LCGISTSLVEVVVFRLLQGVFGAGLSPISQSIMVNTYPKEERGRAMAIWGLGIMVGPILGPTLGGYLTQVLSWRWTFYINVPVGIISFLITWFHVPDTEKRERTMDWTGLVLLGFAIGGLQYVLDRGNRQDWFAAADIKIISLIAVVGFLGFLYHTWKRRGGHTLFQMQIFRDRNFVTASTLIFVLGLSMYGTLVLQPMLFEDLLNYPVLTTGLVMAPRGISSMIGMFIVGRLINRIQPRVLIGFGAVTSIISAYAMTYYNLDIDTFWIIWPQLLQGLGMGFIFVPMATVAYATLPLQYSAEAAGLFSLTRTIGSSIGISIVSTLLTRHTQMAWNQLGGHITATNPALDNFLGHMHLSLHSPAAAAMLGQVLGRQARMQAFLDCFLFITVSFLVMLPLVFLLKKPPRERAGHGSAAAAME
jgi:DHA2 family multidrug resistance protein